MDIAEAVSKALFMPKSHENFRVLAYLRSTGGRIGTEMPAGRAFSAGGESDIIGISHGSREKRAEKEKRIGSAYGVDETYRKRR